VYVKTKILLNFGMTLKYYLTENILCYKFYVTKHQNYSKICQKYAKIKNWSRELIFVFK